MQIAKSMLMAAKVADMLFNDCCHFLSWKPKTAYSLNEQLLSVAIPKIMRGRGGGGAQIATSSSSHPSINVDIYPKRLNV